MMDQQFHEILAELERWNFWEVLDMTRACFREQHKEEEILAYFHVHLRFNWKKNEENHTVEAEQIVPLLKGLSEESRFCLESVSIDPVIDYVDEAGKERKFTVNEAWNYFSGNIQPHWQELHYRLEGGEEQIVSRKALVVGSTIAQTPNGPLKVYSKSDYSLSLMLGTNVVRLSENKEYLVECLPGVEAAVYYDHNEFPALWSWLHIDDETEGKDTPWYRKRHESKEDLYEGMEFIDGDPTVKIVKINDRSLTLSVSTGLQGRLNPKEIVLDQPNHEVVIWKQDERSLKAKLYVPEPNKKWSSHYQNTEPVPRGCVVSFNISKRGEDAPACSGTIDVRTVPCRLKMDDYKGDVYWNWFEVWGFVDGKMVVGVDCPQYNSNSCAFKGLLDPGKEYTFPINDDDGDGEHVHNGQITLSWVTEDVGLVIKDGVLKSIPDVEEFTVPEEVREMHFQSLLTAPSLRKITLRAGVERYWSAIDTYYDECHVKLDVEFEGSVQEWFDSACYLANCIGRLVIQGKAYDFYDTPDLVIPEGVSRIGANLFSRSNTLRSLVLPPEVVEIGDHAFAYCDHLQSVKVLGPASIGGSAFVSCHDLSDIYLADGVVSLGYGCFDFLTKVRSIFIPKSVKEVLILSGQNDGSCMAPAFLCEAPSKPSGWVKNWNLAYFDPRFGLGHGYDYYHPVKWGCKREEE
jgi:hypothetical protein